MRRLGGIVLVPLFLALASLGCESDPTPGVCCPVADSPCGQPGGWSAGGWAASQDACSANIRMTYDGRFDRVADEHGCVQWVGTTTGPFCCGCLPDGGALGSDGGS